MGIIPRQDWDQYFGGLALAASTRSTCKRRKVGCVLVKNHRVLSMGYNGSPPGEPHCIDVGCNIVDGRCVRTIHAETNAIHGLMSIMGKKGAELLVGASAYCTVQPCTKCMQLLEIYGITDIHWLEEYR